MNINNFDVKNIQQFLSTYLPRGSAETLGWLAIVVINCATIPTLLALLTGLSDHAPPLDIILFQTIDLILK